MSKKNVFSILFITFVMMNRIEALLFWSDPLNVVKDEIESTINLGIDNISKQLNEANKQINNISAELIISSVEFSQEIYNQVFQSFETMTNKLHKLTTAAEIHSNQNNTRIDLRECKKISETIDLEALVAYSNLSSCVVDKMELGDGYSETIKKITDDVLTNFTMLKNDVHDCLDNIANRFTSNTKAILCLNDVGVRVSWVTLNSIPDTITNITNLITKMATLKIALPYCAVTHGIEDLSKKYSAIYNETKRCVDIKTNTRETQIK